jgi:hypothetical protein
MQDRERCSACHQHHQVGGCVEAFPCRRDRPEPAGKVSVDGVTAARRDQGDRDRAAMSQHCQKDEHRGQCSS